MRRLFALIAFTLLAACQDAPQNPNLAPISFNDQPPLRVAVQRVEVIDTYKPTYRMPNVDHEFVFTPTQMVHGWANDRLKAVGTDGRIEVEILDASVKQVDLPVTEGLRGLFNDDQSARYEASVKAVIRLYDGESAMSSAESNISVSRSQTIRKKASVAEREKLWHTMIQQIAGDFDRQAEMNLRQYFSLYLR